MDELSGHKLSARLTESLAGHGASDPVEVIVELRAIAVSDSGSRPERIKMLQDEFDRSLQPVLARIAEVGGTVLRTAWLSQTLHGAVPVEGLSSVAAVDEVLRIDLPSQLRRTASSV